MIKNLVFDLGGVIVPLNRISCLRAFDEVIGYRDFEQILSSYRQHGYFEKFETGAISSRKFRQIIRSHASPSADGKPRNITDRQIDYCLNRFLSDIPQDRIDALLFFRNDYRMLLLSNTNPIGMDYCRKLFMDKGYRITDIFERLYLSYKMKLAKPDPEIYRRMIEDSGIIPEETLYIDDYAANVTAGKEAGLHSILFTPGKEDLYAKISEFIELEQR